MPFVTDLHESFYFKGEGDNSVWVCPLDETLVDPCDAAPEEIDVATAIDRFEKAVNWPVEAVERNGDVAALGTAVYAVAGPRR